jgi:DNA polymerase III alpha subunit
LILALGMLSCMKRGFDLLAKHKGINLDLATIPSEDPRTYAMIRKADTLGVFQIESRAQQVPSPRGQCAVSVLSSVPTAKYGRLRCRRRTIDG